MTETMRWLGVVGGFSALIAVTAGGCTIKSVSGDGDGGSGSGNGNVTSGNPGSTTGSNQTSTSSGYGGEGGATTTTTGNSTSTGMVTCDYDPNDACGTCSATQCCDQIEACDANCQAEYAAYADCISQPDGYNSNYCKYNYTGEGSAAEAVIICLETNCYTGDKCGEDIPQPRWDPEIAEFTEKYCVGCHTDDYSSPNPDFEITAQYNDDENNFWFEPFGDANWKSQLSYANSKADGVMWWCGISKDLPADCASLFPADMIHPNGHFPSAKRFPPVGGTIPGTAGATSELHCWWTADATLCEQPTDQERAMVNNWIFADYPQ